MSYQVRSVVTGHTVDGKPAVVFDSKIQRTRSLSEVLWTTQPVAWSEAVQRVGRQFCKSIP
jgi:hypothetical protein